MQSEAQRRAKAKYRATTGKGKRKNINISVTTEKYNQTVELLTANGYTIAQFWHYCIDELSAGKIPPKSATAPTSEADTKPPKE